MFVLHPEKKYKKEVKLDDVLYQSVFFTNKVKVIQTIKSIRSLEAVCDMISTADKEDLHLYVDRLKNQLLDYKTMKFELISRAFFEDTPNPYDYTQDTD
jgi:hypothetical protein